LPAAAVACSAAWDTSDIVVIGAEEADMACCCQPHRRAMQRWCRAM